MTATQTPLFCESIFEAASDVVRALGGPKVVGGKLWPEKGVDASATLLRDCLNPHRRERLDPEQLLLLAKLGRDAGCHSLMHYFADATGYERPRPVEPQDELAQLVDQATRLTQAQQAVAAKLERLLGAAGPQLRKVGA